MQDSLRRKITLIIMITFLLAISGCTRMLGCLPAPPNFIAKIDLKNNYDGDIPKKTVKQLKWASLTSNWSVPYIFLNVAGDFESAGDEVRAIHYYDRAITEARKRNDAYGEGTITNRKILALCKFGKMQDAYNTIKDAEKNWPNAPLNAFVAQSYGHYYLLGGDYGQALKYFRLSLDANQSFHDNFNLLTLRRDSAMEYGMALILADYMPAISAKLRSLDFNDEFYKAVRRNVDEGIANLNQVALLNKEISKTKINRLTQNVVWQTLEANAGNYLGLAYGLKGQLPEAINKLNAAGKLSEEIDYPLGEVNNSFFRQQVYILAKNSDAGQKSAQQLNELADKYHLPFYQLWSKVMLSRYSLLAGDTSKAINLLKDALAIMENQHTEPAMAMFQESTLFNQQALYEELIGLLADKGDFAGALATAERAKSWIMVNLLAGEDIGKNPAESELIKQNKIYSKEIADGQRAIIASAGRDANLKKVLDKIEKAESAQRDVMHKIKAQNEELHSLVAVEPPDIEGLRQLLDKNTTLFCYYVTDKVLYVWAVTKDQVYLERIKITKKEVAALVSSFVAVIGTKDKKQTDDLSEKVYDTFLKPVIPFVSGDRIGFIPHGALCYLPFAAMSYKGQYLVDGFSIFTLPNAGVLKYLMKKQVALEMKVLAFANPDLGDKQLDLPFAEAEGESIKKNIPQTTVLVRGEATKAKVKELIGNYDLIHFAARGIFEEGAPLNSGLLLAAAMPDAGRLTTAEIFKLQFKGRAVMMSAFNENIPGLSSTGTEMMAFNRAFLYAGSPSVVSTIWNNEDKSKAILMDIFYRNMKINESIADSLRVTQNEMIKLGYPPYDWAAFTLTGRY